MTTKPTILSNPKYNYNRLWICKLVLNMNISEYLIWCHINSDQPAIVPIEGAVLFELDSYQLRSAHYPPGTSQNAYFFHLYADFILSFNLWCVLGCFLCVLWCFWGVLWCFGVNLWTASGLPSLGIIKTRTHNNFTRLIAYLYLYWYLRVQV